MRSVSKPQLSLAQLSGLLSGLLSDININNTSYIILSGPRKVFTAVIIAVIDVDSHVLWLMLRFLFIERKIRETAYHTLSSDGSQSADTLPDLPRFMICQNMRT